MATAADGTHPTGMHSCPIYYQMKSDNTRCSCTWNSDNQLYTNLYQEVQGVCEGWGVAVWGCRSLGYVEGLGVAGVQTCGGLGCGRGMCGWGSMWCQGSGAVQTLR